MRVIIKNLLSVILLGGTINLCMAQADTLMNGIRKYKAKITTIDGRVYKGFVNRLSDDSIMLVSQNNPSHYSEIKTLKLQRKGSTGRGILLGGLSGMATGALVGLTEEKVEDNYTGPEFVSLEKGPGTYALLGLPVGMSLGAIASFVIIKKHNINGEAQKYKNVVQGINKKVLKRKKRQSEI